MEDKNTGWENQKFMSKLATNEVKKRIFHKNGEAKKYEGPRNLVPAPRGIWLPSVFFPNKKGRGDLLIACDRVE